jgi:hypothetical protein
MPGDIEPYSNNNTGIEPFIDAAHKLFLPVLRSNVI